MDEPDCLCDMPASRPTEFTRIAVVWLTDWMQAQTTFNAMCRRADLDGRVTMQLFNASAPDFEKDVVQPLKRWKPHGVVVRMMDMQKLALLRRHLPRIPYVL